MKHNCNKCRKSFSSNYLLQKHINRKIPCNKSIQCDKCNRIFKTPQQLNNHINRKTLCVKENEQHSSEIEDKIRLIQAKKNAQLEIIQARKDSLLEIEREKLKRKSQVVNINNIIHNTVISNTINIVNYNENNISEMLKDIGMRNFRWYIEKLILDKNINNFMTKLIAYAHNNENYPEYKNITHENNSFYTAENNKWMETKFENIYPILRHTLYNIILSTGKHIDKSNVYNSLTNDEKNVVQVLFQSCDYICKEKSKKSIESLQIHVEKALSSGENILDEKTKDDELDFLLFGK